MAAVDSNPLIPPVRSTPPGRRIDPDEKGGGERPRPKRRDDEKKKKNNGDGDVSPHIDEYA